MTTAKHVADYRKKHLGVDKERLTLYLGHPYGKDRGISGLTARSECGWRPGTGDRIQASRWHTRRCWTQAA